MSTILFHSSSLLLSPRKTRSRIQIFIGKKALDFDIFVCIYSQSFPGSKWCMRELDIAVGHRKEILPIYLDGSVPPDSVSGATRLSVRCHQTQCQLMIYQGRRLCGMGALCMSPPTLGWSVDPPQS